MAFYQTVYVHVTIAKLFKHIKRTNCTIYFKYSENNSEENNEEFHFLLFTVEILSLEKIYFIA